jgi:small redox-active disulfide protein 2
MNIKVLGPGCMNCKKVLELVQQAVKELGVEAQIEYLTGRDNINRYIMLTPGIVIDEQVVHQGKPLPDHEKVKTFIRKAAGG